MVRWRVALIFGAIALLALLLRLPGLGSTSFWLDEFLTLQISTGWAHQLLPTDVLIAQSPDRLSLNNARSIGSVIQSVESSGHPPLFFLVLRGWVEMFGTSDGATRALSVLSSLIALLLLARCAWILHGRDVAILVTFLAAIAPAQIEFAQEARNYAFVLPLALGAALALIEIEIRGSNPARLVALSVCTLAIVLTHYFALGVPIGLAVYAAIRLRGRVRRDVVVAFSAAAVVFLLLWGPTLIRQIPTFGAQDPWLKEPAGAVHWSDTALRALRLPARLITGAADSNFLQWSVLGVTLYLLMLFPRRVQNRLLWTAWCLGCIGLILALDLLRGTKLLEFVRYSFFASPAILVIPFAALPRKLHIAAFATLALVCMATFSSAYVEKLDRRSIAAVIDERVPPTEPLIFSGAPGIDWFAPAEFLSISKYARPNRPIVLLRASPPPSLRQQLDRYPRLWVFRSRLSPHPDAIFPGYRVVGGQRFGDYYELIALTQPH